MLLQDLIKIDNRWSFRLGGGYFDKESYLKNLEIVRFICESAKKLNLKYAFSGIWGLALNYGYAYRNFKDLDILIDRNSYKAWSNLLLENGWRYCGFFQNDNIPLSEIEKLKIKSSEKFASDIPDKMSSESKTATIYKYNKNQLSITRASEIINTYNTIKDPQNFIHIPTEDILFEQDSFKFIIKVRSFNGVGDYNCFLYYTKNETIPEGAEGEGFNSTEVSILEFKDIKDGFAIWESPPFDKNLLNNIFQYKLSIFNSCILRFANQDEFIIDLIIESPRRLSTKNMSYKIFNENTKVYFSNPDFIWMKKMLYGRNKDRIDEKYYKKIIVNY